MQRSVIWWAFGLVAVGGVYAGCTQDFGQFEATGGAGGSSSHSTGALTGGGGAGGDCDAPRDCPAATQPCQVATCSNHQCGTTDAADGSACSDKGGSVCSSGSCVECNESDDCGDTSDDCKHFNCLGDHTCQLVNNDLDTPCGATGQLSCTGSGCGMPTGMCVCSGCEMPMDCGVDTECVTFDCLSGGHCSQTNTPDGTATSNQAAGDCMENQCQTGVETGVVDGTDTPADEGPCRFGVCQGGTPGQQNRDPDDACNGNNVCDNNSPPNCVECTQTSMGNCTGPEVCFMSSCCTPLGKAAACGTMCSGMVSNGCGGMITCDISVCGGVSPVCNGGMCCTRTNKATACGNMCGGGMASDGCGGMYTCNDNASCTLGHCVDAVCCDTACTGTCAACNLAGSMGTCTGIPSQTDDVGLCDDTHGGCGAGFKCTCDGVIGECKRQNGESCANPGGGNGVCSSGNCVSNLCAP